MATAECPDCGGRTFTFDLERGLATCICGIQQPLSQRPAQQEQALEQPATPVRKGQTPKKGGKAQKVLRFLSDAGEKLGGLPNFIVKDAVRMHLSAIKDRKGCPEIGIALASLQRSMLKFDMVTDPAELCRMTNGRVDSKQLTACVQVVARQNTEASPTVVPVPLLDRLMGALCMELKLKGMWLKAAHAVAVRAASLGLDRDAKPLELTAALVMLVVDRQAPKEKMPPSAIAAAAGLSEENMVRCYTDDLLPHMHELLEASQDAILPSGCLSLSAPAPPTPPLLTKQKPVSKKRKQPSKGKGKEEAASPAARGGPEPDKAAAQGPPCKHCGSEAGGEHHELCASCAEDQCWLCGRVDPIATNELHQCFGCMRENVLRSRLRVGALRSHLMPSAPPPPRFVPPPPMPGALAQLPPHFAPIPNAAAAVPPMPPPPMPPPPMPPPPMPPPPMPPPPPPVRSASPAPVAAGATTAPAPAAALAAAPAAAPAAQKRVSPRFSPLGTSPTLPASPAPALGPSTPLPPAAAGAAPPPASQHLLQCTLAAGSPSALSCSSPSWMACARSQSPSAAVLSAEWERPMSDEELCMLLSSPCRPSTPSHSAPPPYPTPSPTMPESPRHGPAHPPSGGLLLGYLGDAPPRGPSPRGVAGEQRALAEWAVASSRHAPPSPSPAHGCGAWQSPAHGCGAWQSPLHWTAPSPLHSAAACCDERLLRRSPRVGGAALISLAPSAAGTPISFGPQRAAPGFGFGALPRVPLRPSTEPRSSPAWVASSPAWVGAADPRSSPAWVGPAGAVGVAGARGVLERPGTDPRTHSADSLTMLRRSPRFLQSSSPCVSASPRHSAGLMLPPPPRNKQLGPKRGEDTHTNLTDEDIQVRRFISFLAEGCRFISFHGPWRLKSRACGSDLRRHPGKVPPKVPPKMRGWW